MIQALSKAPYSIRHWADAVDDAIYKPCISPARLKTPYTSRALARCGRQRLIWAMYGLLNRRRWRHRANARLIYGAVDHARPIPGWIRRRRPCLNHVFAACLKLIHRVNTARMRCRPRRVVIGRRELHSCMMSTIMKNFAKILKVYWF